MGYVEGLKAELKYCETWATERVDEVKAEIEKVLGGGSDKTETQVNASPGEEKSQNAEAEKNKDSAQASSQEQKAEPILETATSRIATNTTAVTKAK